MIEKCEHNSDKQCIGKIKYQHEGCWKCAITQVHKEISLAIVPLSVNEKSYKALTVIDAPKKTDIQAIFSEIRKNEITDPGICRKLFEVVQGDRIYYVYNYCTVDDLDKDQSIFFPLKQSKVLITLSTYITVKSGIETVNSTFSDINQYEKIKKELSLFRKFNVLNANENDTGEIFETDHHPILKFLLDPDMHKNIRLCSRKEMLKKLLIKCSPELIRTIVPQKRERD